jgi:glycerol uptake facilitator protein
MAAPPTTAQKLAAEFLGTGFLVFIGAGSAAATGVIAAGTKAPFSMAELGMISFAFMLVIVGAVYAIGHISGGHINPAVTLSLAVSGKFSWREVPGYWAAQLAGAIAGVFVIFGVIDHRAVPGWAPMAIGAIVFAVIIVVGPATGAAINPARYLGAVLMLKAFGGHVLWSQVPAYLIGDLVGGVLGGLAWAAIGKVRADASFTSLAPAEPVPGIEKVAEGTS